MNEGSVGPKIEMDLESADPSALSRRQRPMMDQVAFERPKIEPVLKDDSIGSDESQRTVGFLMLISLLPELMGGLLGHGSVSFLGLGIPAIVAWGLISGSDFITEYAFWACATQLVLAPVMVFTLPHAALLVPAVLFRYGGLAVLLSGKPLSRNAYFAALGAIGLGVLLGIIGTLLR
jgi:hypothetical protein